MGMQYWLIGNMENQGWIHFVKMKRIEGRDNQCTQEEMAINDVIETYRRVSDHHFCFNNFSSIVKKHLKWRPVLFPVKGFISSKRSCCCVKQWAELILILDTATLKSLSRQKLQLVMMLSFLYNCAIMGVSSLSQSLAPEMRQWSFCTMIRVASCSYRKNR